MFFDAKTVPAVILLIQKLLRGLDGRTVSFKRSQGFKISKFPFGANGRAVSMLQTDGFVKIIADAKRMLF